MSNTLRSADAFAEAVRLDLGFALAWAHLSRQHSFYFNGAEPTAARRDLAKKALENATTLQPALLETQLADGFFHYWVERDYAKAKVIFEAIAKHTRIIPTHLMHSLQSRGGKDIGTTPALFSPRQWTSIHRMYSCWPTRVSI